MQIYRESFTFRKISAFCNPKVPHMALTGCTVAVVE